MNINSQIKINSVDSSTISTYSVRKPYQSIVSSASFIIKKNNDINFNLMNVNNSNSLSTIDIHSNDHRGILNKILNNKHSNKHNKILNNKSYNSINTHNNSSTLSTIDRFLIEDNNIPSDEYKQRLKSIMQEYRYEEKVIDLTQIPGTIRRRVHRYVDPKKLKDSYLPSPNLRNKSHKEKEETAIQISIEKENYQNALKAREVLAKNRIIYQSVLFNYQKRKDIKHKEHDKQKHEILKDFRDYAKLRVTNILPKNIELLINSNNSNNSNNTTPLKVESNFLPKYQAVFYDRDNNSTDMYAYYIYAKQNFPEGREQFCWCAEDKTFLLYGGIVSNRSNHIWSLDPSNVEWKILESDGLPTPRFGHTGVLYNNKLYVFGGKTKINDYPYCPDLEVFNVDENSWSTPVLYTKSHLKLRRNHVAKLIGANMFIHGGISEDEEYLSDSFLLCLSPLKWLPVSINSEGELPTLAWHSCCVVLPSEQLNNPKLSIYKLPEQRRNNRIREKGIYLFGGKSSESGNFKNDVWVLKIGKKPLEWTKINTYGTPPTPRCAHTMDFYEEGNYLIVHGGRSDASIDGYAFNETYLLELNRLDWIKVGLYFDLPDTNLFNRCAHSSLIFTNKLLIFGGMNSKNYIGSSMLVVDLDSPGRPKPNQNNDIDNILKNYEENKKQNKQTSRNHKRKLSIINSNDSIPQIK